MRVFRLSRITCIKETPVTPPILYSLFQNRDGKFIRVSDASYSDIKQAIFVFSYRMAADATLSIRVARIESKRIGDKNKASWNMKSECKWLLNG